MEDNSVIKEGLVLVQKKRGLETYWVKKHCKLHRKTNCREAYLELVGTSGKSKSTSFADIKINEEKSSEKGCIQVEIICKKLNFLLIPPEDDLLDWLFKFTLANRGGECRYNNSKVHEEENVRFLKLITSLNQAIWFDVELLETDLAKRCGIAGKSKLIICKQKFRLIRPTLEATQTFCFSWLKRIHREKGTVDVTIGKQSESGEGLLNFHSENGYALYRIIRVLMQISRQESELPCAGFDPTDKGGNVGDLQWFHGCISREYANQMLTDRPEGTFLVRKSESYPNDYVLSFICNGLQHLRISTKQGRYYLSGVARGFNSLHQIVADCTENSYQLTTVDGLEVKWKLKNPLIKNIDYGMIGSSANCELKSELRATCPCPDRRSHGLVGSEEDILHELFLHELDSDKLPQRTLTKKEYSTLSLSAFGRGWKQIGFQLGFDDIELEHIEMNHPNKADMRINAMLLKWDKKEADEARLDFLVKAIVKCPSHHVAVKWTVFWNLIHGL